MSQHGPSSPTLVQLAPRAACADATTLLRAGATVVAPELRLDRLRAAAAERIEPGLKARDALQTMTTDRPAGRLTARTADDPLVAEEWWRSVVGIDGLTPPGPGRPVTVVDSGISASHPEFAGRPNLELLNPQQPEPLG